MGVGIVWCAQREMEVASGYELFMRCVLIEQVLESIVTISCHTNGRSFSSVDDVWIGNCTGKEIY